MRRSRVSTAGLTAALTAVAIGLAACTGGGSQASGVAEPQEPGASSSPTAPPSQAPEATDPSPSTSPTASATASASGVLPPLTSGQSMDALTDARQARAAVGRRFELQDTATGTVLYPGDRTIKPSGCVNVDSLLDRGAPASPTIGVSTSMSMAATKGRGFVFQSITPSDQAISVVDYLREQATGPCRDYTAATPATLIINNGPSKDIDTIAFARPRAFEAAGTPVHAYLVTLRSRTSADVTYGRPATTSKIWFLVSSAGSNLVTTLSGGITGGEVLELHRGTVERVVDAATAQAEAGGLAEPAPFEPAGRDSAASSQGSATQDDPTWPIDEVAREVRGQWQGSKPSLNQVRNMVLLVCRQMRDIEFTDPRHSSTMQNLQGRIVTKWKLDRITGPFNAWNLIGTADARCKGATVITQMN